MDVGDVVGVFLRFFLATALSKADPITLDRNSLSGAMVSSLDREGCEMRLPPAPGVKVYCLPSLYIVLVFRIETLYLQIFG